MAAASAALVTFDRPGLACGGGGQAMQRHELIFGQSRPGGGTVSEAEWNAFLAEFVTPRLPEGFTVLDGYGQWRDRTTGVVTREASRILVVWHVADTTLPQSLDTIRNTYRARFAQESVMAVAGVSCVRF